MAGENVEQPKEKSPEVKAVVGFATAAAVKGPIPKAIKLFYRSLAVASTIWAIVVEPIFTDIPTPIAHHIDQGLLALNTAIYQISQLFGWVTPSNTEEQTTKV